MQTEQEQNKAQELNRYMNSLIGLIYLNFLLSSCSITSVQKVRKKNRQIFVYQVIYKGAKYESVRGITLYDDNLYIQPRDSLLMTYKGLSKRAKHYENPEAMKLLNGFNADSLKVIKDYNNCDCTVITKNEYIIRIVEGHEVKNFVFTEVLKCNPSSPCIFLEKLHFIFEETK